MLGPLRRPAEAVPAPAAAPASVHRSTAWPWIGIFALALALRAAHVLVLVRQSVFWDANTQGGSDMSGFIRFATQMAAEGGFWDRRGIYTNSAPLFPMALAGLFRLLGPDLALAAAGQAVLSAATCLVIGWMALYLFGERRIAFLAAALAALYGPFIFFTTKLHATTLEVGAAALAFGAIAWAIRRPALWRWFAAGLAAGVTALARPTFTVVAAATGLGLLARPGARLRERAGAAAMVGLGAGAVVGAAVVRTALLGGPWVPISGQLGVAWRLANSYDSYALNFRYPRAPLMPAASLAFWAHQAQKAALFWWGYEVPQNMNYYFLREFSPVLRLPLPAYWFVAPLAWLGLWWSRGRWRELLPLHLAMLSYYVVTFLFLITARYRIPIVPALMPFAAFALAGLWDRARAGGWRAVAVPGLVCVALMAAAMPHRERLIHSTEYAYLARDAAARGEGPRAQWALERGIRLFPRALGDRADPAAAVLRAVREGAGDRPMPEGRRQLYLGLSTLLTEGPPREALEDLRLAAAAFPREPAAAALRRLLGTFFPGGSTTGPPGGFPGGSTTGSPGGFPGGSTSGPPGMR
jgi:4-amino-4-deoxy-L-arabinose transferase-like glycosyltransferase